MSLRGEIETMPLSDLFQWLALKRKTGALGLMNGSTVQKFYFSEGLIANASSTPYPVARNEQGIKQMLADTLFWSEGGFNFVEAPLPEEAIAINLRLHTQQLVLDILRQSNRTAEAASAVSTGAGGTSQTTPAHTPPLAEGLRLAIFDRLLKGQFKLPLLPTLVRKVMEITQR